MRKFAFPLEKALEIRQLKKLLAEEALGESRRKEEAARARLDAALTRRLECFDEIRRALAKKVDAVEMRHIQRYRVSVEDDVARQETDLARRREATERALAEAVARTLEERTLERHKENLKREYMADFWWEDGKALDEMASQRFNRMRTENRR